MSAALAIGLWGAFAVGVIYGLSCDAIRWLKNRRERRQAEREARQWSEIAELEMEYALPSAPGSPRWTR